MNTYYNDIEAYPCKVLRARINDGLLPPGLVDERDICTVTAQDIAPYTHVHLFAGIGVFALGFLRAGVPSDCHIMTGGFPCQDLSVAGKQAGLSGDRSGLWFQMVRLIEESNAIGNPFDFIVIENVRNLLSGGDYAEDAIRATDSGTMGEVAADAVWQSWMGTVLADLAEVGYDAEWQCLRASDYGAPHRRERIFIVDYPSGIGSRSRRPERAGQQWTPVTHGNGTARLADPNGNSGGWTQRANAGNMVSQTGTHIERRGYLQWSTAQCGSANVAYPASGKQIRSGGTWTGRDEPANVGTVEYPDSQRCEEQHAPAVASPSRRTCESDATLVESSTSGRERQYQESRGTQGTQYIFVQPDGRTVESILGRNASRTPDWLDRYRWPARPGEQQYPYEPPRVIRGKLPNRNARLKALGNSLVLPIAEDIGYRIKAAWLARLEQAS